MRNILIKLHSDLAAFFSVFKQTLEQFKKQYAFELKNISTCSKTAKHLVEAKIAGKGQSVLYLAEEVVADNDFVMGFSPSDVRTITYLATCDKYEAILREEKVKKSYEVIRSKNIDGKKTVMIRNTLTGDSVIRFIQDFSDLNLVDNLDSKDAYYVGYLAGQEQTFRDFARLRLLSSKKDDGYL